MDNEQLRNIPLLVLFSVASVFLFLVYRPFLSVLALAAVSAVMLHGFHERSTRLLRGRNVLSASLIVALVSIFFVVPIFFLGLRIFQEAQNLFVGIQGNGRFYIEMVRTVIEGPVQRWAPGFTFDVHTAVGNAITFISNNLGALVYQTLSVVFGAFLMLLALFFFLRDGRALLASLVSISPFGRRMTDEILNTMYLTIRSVVRGTLCIVAIRSACMWMAFSLFGIPNAIFWSSLGGVLGAIPGLGTAFAFIGAAAYLYLEGHTMAALGLVLAGVFAVVLIDNILTSFFFGKGLAVSSIFVLFAILGGIAYFGPLGFILGPLTLSVFLSIVRTSSVAHPDMRPSASG